MVDGVSSSGWSSVADTKLEFAISLWILVQSYNFAHTYGSKNVECASTISASGIEPGDMWNRSSKGMSSRPEIEEL